MALVHVTPDASAEECASLLRENGYVIVDRLADNETMDRVQAELAAYIDATPYGGSELTGELTRRTGALIERSPTARRLILDPLILGVLEQCLTHAGSYQLSLTEVISLSPGAPAQFIHRDELQFGGYPFSVDYEIQISTLWAMTEYTEEMGATRVVPGSHREESCVRYAPDDTRPAEMERGSVLIYSGKLYHGGGANRSQKVRQAMNIDYTVDWVRQEENQYLSCEREVARSLPPKLLELMGYHAPDGHGRVYDWNDPLSLLRGGNERVSENHLDIGEVYEKIYYKEPKKRIR